MAAEATRPHGVTEERSYELAEIRSEMKKYQDPKRYIIQVHQVKWGKVPLSALQKVVLTYEQCEPHIAYWATQHLVQWVERSYQCPGPAHSFWEKNPERKVVVQNSSEVPLQIQFFADGKFSPSRIIQPNETIKVDPAQLAFFPKVSVPHGVDVPRKLEKTLFTVSLKELKEPRQQPLKIFCYFRYVSELVIKDSSFEGMEITYTTVEVPQGEEGESHRGYIAQSQEEMLFSSKTNEFYKVNIRYRNNHSLKTLSSRLLPQPNEIAEITVKEETGREILVIENREK